MSRRQLIFLTGACLFLASSARAGSIPEPGVGVHIASVITKNQCEPPAGVTDPYHFRFVEPTLSTPEGPFYFLYVMGCNYLDRGLGGIEFGINYPGGYEPAGGLQPICVFDWTLCADLEFPSTGWPAPGGGNLITWSTANCGPDVQPEWFIMYKVAGFFYLGAYSPAQFTITTRPVSGLFKVADCAAVELDLTHDGYARGIAGFGNTSLAWPGCYSQGLPVESTTWSGIKALHE
jgi:hypothetical protein